jgi:hypothetical protein
MVDRLLKEVPKGTTVVYQVRLALAKGSYVADKTNLSHLASEIVVTAKCIRVASEVRLSHGAYSKAHVAHGADAMLGDMIPAAIIQAPGGGCHGRACLSSEGEEPLARIIRERAA